MSITSAQGVTALMFRPRHIGKPFNGCWQIEESIMSPAFSLTPYVISTRRKAKRESPTAAI